MVLLIPLDGDDSAEIAVGDGGSLRRQDLTEVNLDGADLRGAWGYQQRHTLTGDAKVLQPVNAGETATARQS
jgi:uncharacterized protein YjbI with pentapeptide repeats